MQLPPALGRASALSPAALLALTVLSGLLLFIWPVLSTLVGSLLLDSLPEPLVSLTSSPTTPLRWDDFARIRRHTRPASEGVVAPVRLRHLQQYQAAEPYREVFVFSSYLDTRPLLVQRDPAGPKDRPQIAIIASLLGAPFMSMPSLAFPDQPLRCHIVMKGKNGQPRSYITASTTLNGLPDPHEHEVQMVSAVFNCPVEGDDWEDAEMELHVRRHLLPLTGPLYSFVSLSLPSMPPPSDVFLPVTALPILNPVEHRRGHGSAAVCLPPLTGEIYAPFIADYIAYYTSLGFSHFYSYLLDPGPQTLEVFRQVAAADPTVQPIRWALHQGLKYSATYAQHPTRNLQVDPSLWKLPGVEDLDANVEFEMGGVGEGVHDIRIWYFGQSAAQQDCAFRAMRDGHRWVFSGDYDEFLLLKPAGDGIWPPPATSSATSLFSEWARSVEKRWTWPETLPYDLSLKHGVDVATTTYGMLPAAFTFQSSFACIRCTPSRAQPPPPTEAILRLESAFPSIDWSKPGPGFPLSLISPVRSEAWFNQGFRSKAVVDPWAWWSLGIHYAGLGYADWALTRGFCATEADPKSRRAAHTDTCARDLLHSLGRNTVLVRTPEPTSNITESNALEHAVGALYHFRVDKKLSQALSRFNTEANEEGLDVIQGQEGISLLTEQRIDQYSWDSQYGDESTLVQDWQLLATHGGALMELLERKKKWGATKWIAKGKSKRRRVKRGKGWIGVRMLLGGAWLAVAALVVRPLWRKGQLGAKGLVGRRMSIKT